MGIILCIKSRLLQILIKTVSYYVTSQGLYSKSVSITSKLSKTQEMRNSLAVCLHSVVDSRHICLLLLLKTMVNCNVASASVSSHTFSFMSLYKFVFNFNFLFTGYLGLHTSISSQFTLEVCATAENRKKNHYNALFWGFEVVQGHQF